MLKKRLSGIVIVKNGWAVQSFGYKKYLPLGKPECLVENLDRWGADEIFILCIDRYKNELGPDFELLEKIGKLGLETPLIYGGGIRTVKDSVDVIQLGADRICIDGLMHDDPDIIKKISERLGVQAVIGVLPISWNNNSIDWLDYRSKESKQISTKTLETQTRFISELLLIDWKNEGKSNSFDDRLIVNFPKCDSPLIVFGGLDNINQMIQVLSEPKVAAIAVGNFLNYKEHSIQSFKKSLNEMSLRLPEYETKYK